MTEREKDKKHTHINGITRATDRTRKNTKKKKKKKKKKKNTWTQKRKHDKAHGGHRVNE